MKQTIAVLMLCALLLSGCAAEPEAPAASENEFLVLLVNDTGEELYQIHYEYYLNDRICGGCVTGNADGSMIQPGETFFLRFLPEDFPNGADLSQFRIQFFALDRNGRESPMGTTLSIPAACGQSFRVSLTATGTDSYIAKRIR